MRSIALRTVEDFAMLQVGDKVVIGLSGGADSVSLLHVLHTNSAALGIEVRAVHINHCIRGEEAERDQAFCESFCASLGVKLYTFRVDVPTLAAQTGIGLEEAGRNARYNAFSEAIELWKQERNGTYRYLIATAHTLSDSVETMLFNMTRGCGIGGLCGIPAMRDNIIRPLINVTREQVESYCSANGLDFVTDSTNTDTQYSRNMLRHEIIPRLRGLNSSIEQTLGRLARSAYEDNVYLCQMAEAVIERALLDKTDRVYDIGRILESDAAVRHRVVMMLVKRETKISLSSRQLELIEQCIAEGSGAVELSDKWTVRVKSRRLSIDCAETVSDDNQSLWSVQWDMCSPIRLPDGRMLEIEVVEAPFKESVKKSAAVIENALDYGIIEYNVHNLMAILRNRRAGDRFTLNARGVTKSVKKLFNELGVPAKLRSRLVFLQLGEDIAWIEGIGTARGYAPSRESDKFVLIKISEGIE